MPIGRTLFFVFLATIAACDKKPPPRGYYVYATPKNGTCDATCESHPDVVWLRTFTTLGRRGVKGNQTGSDGIVGLMGYISNWDWYQRQFPISADDFVRIPKRQELLESAGVGSVAELKEFLKNPSNMEGVGEYLGVRYEKLKKFQSFVREDDDMCVCRRPRIWSIEDPQAE